MLPHLQNRNKPSTGCAVKEWAKSICPFPIEHEFRRYSNAQMKQIAERPRNKRSVDFQMGRECSYAALRRLGASGEIGVQSNRAPKWPEGTVGSISHSESLAWAAVATDPRLQAVGVDTEMVVDEATLRQLQSVVLRNEEWARLSALAVSDRSKFTIAFSAKESFYKAWSARTEKFFDFHHAVIRSVSSDRLLVEMTPDNPNARESPKSLTVYFFIDQNDVYTSTWMERG